MSPALQIALIAAGIVNTILIALAVRRMLRRRRAARPAPERIDTLWERLPPPDADLEALKAETVEVDFERITGVRKKSLGENAKLILQEHEGRDRLLAAHALAISAMRKWTHEVRHPYMPHARRIFLRIWREQSAHMLAELDMRWLVSAAATFAENGTTPRQREVGHVAAVYGDMVKLQESERVMFPPSTTRAQWPGGRKLFDGMGAFAVRTGDMIDAMRARAEAAAVREPLAGPILIEVLARLDREDTVFRRFGEIRREHDVRAAGAAEPE